MIRYRPTREADAAALAGLHAQAFPRGWSCNEFAKLLSAPQTCALLAETPGGRGLAGFVVARTVAGEAEILTIAVAAAHRRQGIGRTLMQRLFAAFAERHVGAVFLEVGAENEAALSLYRGLGFAEVGRRHGYYGPGAAGDAVVLRAILAPSAMVLKPAETDYDSAN